MSTEQDKYKNSRRRQQDASAVARQTRIARSHGIDVKEPHKLVKHHAMDCGNPRCHMCGNPRKMFQELTAQEQRLFQDADQKRDRHSNGLPPQED